MLLPTGEFSKNGVLLIRSNNVAVSRSVPYCSIRQPLIMSGAYSSRSESSFRNGGRQTRRTCADNRNEGNNALLSSFNYFIYDFFSYSCKSPHYVVSSSAICCDDLDVCSTLFCDELTVICLYLLTSRQTSDFADVLESV